MVDFNKGWSVASVFNVYGLHRYSTVEMLSNAHRRSRHLRWLDNQSTQAASVADCIRSLGYTVECCWTEESGRYVIRSIRKDEFCYGARGSLIYNHCAEEHQRSFRYLAGHRTIYEKVDNMQLEPRTRHLTQGTVYVPARRLQDLPRHRLENIGGETSWNEMKKWMDDGCISNMYKEGRSSSYVEGVSTLGNTLPPDIVEALKSFRSDDDHFVEEPDYEFYIPDSMKELHMQLPPACPAQEGGGGAAHAGGSPAAAQCNLAAAAQCSPVAVAATPPTNNPSKNTSSSSDSSDSSDSEDD